ncbi:MAG TPA: family 10 glycosylhydrolase [Armatimonadota bacterium]|nr:family 10 glycosylhydrolase [Armatimonadota bacterium]HOS42862.1 family 10 glycosylhydrolase [Armatimonadota bacterium]
MHLGTWLHLLPGSAAEIDAVVDGLAARGITTLITMFKSWTGTIYFPSAVAYTEPGFAAEDLYGRLIARCHERGMAFEAWSCVFPEAGPSKLIDAHPACRALRKDGTEYRVEGNGIAWACPARAETQAHELAAFREVLARYPTLDALHLDYIRYPDTDACYCPACQTEFREQYGFNLLEDVMPGGWEGPAFDAYVRWRTGHITRFVENVADLAHGAGKALTAAVFPYYPSIMFDLGQDWAEWCRRGLLDAVYPMNYNWSPLMVGRYTDLAAHLLRPTRTLHCQGLGLKDAMTADDVRALAQSALDHGAEGIILFEARTLLKLPEATLAPFRA